MTAHGADPARLILEATRAEICSSPPCMPARHLSILRPVASSTNLPVVPVALSVNDNAAADARSERDHQHILHVFACSCGRLAERCAVRVVVELHRAAELRLKRLRKADIVHAEVCAESERAGGLVIRAGHTDADALDLVRLYAARGAQRERELLHVRAQAVRVSRFRRHALLDENRAVIRAERRLDARSA